MTRSIAWTDVAERQLLTMPPREAEELLTAVEAFGATGVGFVRRMLATTEVRLYTRQHIVVVSLEPDRVVIEDVRKR